MTQSELSEKVENLETRVDGFERKQAETNGYLKAVVDQNERYIKLVWRVILILALIAILCLLAVIYGAVGEKGLRSVRDTMSHMPKITFAIPAEDRDWSVLCQDS